MNHQGAEAEVREAEDPHQAEMEEEEDGNCHITCFRKLFLYL